MKVLPLLLILFLAGCATTVTSLNTDVAVEQYRPWQVAADYYVLKTAPHPNRQTLFTLGRKFVVLSASDPAVLKQYESVMIQQGMTERELNSARQRKVFIGMSAAGATASWGRPNDINRTTSQYGSREQWVYSGHNHESNYLYFENGVLTTIQN